ncbi:MAG: 4Fe-4S dicluster domain-containing protein [Bacteroidales bacterium]|nr:4Fe-4S dicluster domain-containing protein [Bacteroidales bacterium]
MEKIYWQSLEKHTEQQASVLENKKPLPEFSIEGLDESEIKGKSTRRDFLKMLGFSVSAVALVSSCQMPVRKAIPLLNQPEELIPGIANYFASTFFDGTDYCSILVKTRENRPIKIEGNEMSPITKGGTSARVQASVLNLYDDARLKHPFLKGIETNWETIDKDVFTQLNALRDEGKRIVLLTSTIISPSTKTLIGEFTSLYPNVEWVMYDPVSMSAIRKANELHFAKAVIPNFRFDKAKIVVGFNADYLGNWLLPVAFTKQYSSNRKLNGGKKTMSRSYQFEGYLSLTGSNTDYRYGIKPSDEGLILMNLYNEIARVVGATTYSVPASPVDLGKVTLDLLENKGASLVVSGTNDVNIQMTVNAINHLLENYGTTIDLNTPINLKQGNDEAMAKLTKDMNSGEIAGLLAYNVNPAYDYFNANEFNQGLNKVGFKLSFSDTMDETAALCDLVCPNHNYLESWGDAEPIRGLLSIMQPTILPIFNTRQFEDSLLIWMGQNQDFSTYMEKNWQKEIQSNNIEVGNFTQFWNQTKQDGVFQYQLNEEPQPDFVEQKLTFDLPKQNAGLEVVLYEKISIGNGKYTNNPWLLEMPDPITTATWDNYLCVSIDYAKQNDLHLEDVVSINGLFEIPVLVQPGQPDGTASIAVGFGRTDAGKAGTGVGQNAYPLMNLQNGLPQLAGSVISIEKINGKTFPLALTQTHHDMEGRPIARETTLPEYLKNPYAGNEQHLFDEEHNVSLYSKVQYDGLHWGMSIDLNSCTGCSNCVIACQSENNVAVIGKEQVKNRRIMHWMRIDRYYSREESNPGVYHMPVMCQHCDNAPCENVCPVAATNHSSEGLNQMAYNRCIGTRYCINNCPYKVRRFNWFEYTNNNKFDYNMNSDLGKMVLNPDVIVRQRGVVEKCSLCVQRIQEKKLEAKMENRELRDGDIKTACQQSCPADAIQFGNLIDTESKVYKQVKEERMYHLLEQLHTLPSTSYLTRVRNTEA